MVILGADLSYTRSAFVWYDTASNEVMEYRTVTIPPGPCRMQRARDELGVLASYDCDKLVVEGPALNVPNPRTLYMLGQLFGVFQLICDEYDIVPIIVSPTELKKFIVGSGKATKDEVAFRLSSYYDIKFDDDKGYDLSDAAACCIYGANHGESR